MSRVITPSRPDYWHGTHTGKALTVEQLNAITGNGYSARRVSFFRKRGGDELYAVKMMTEPRGLEDIPRSVSFVCPVVAITKDRKRICVVAPNGMETWVDKK